MTNGLLHKAKADKQLLPKQPPDTPHREQSLFRNKKDVPCGLVPAVQVDLKYQFFQ